MLAHALKSFGLKCKLNLLISLMEQKMNVILVLYHQPIKGLNSGLWTLITCLQTFRIWLLNFNFWIKLSILSQKYIKSHLSWCNPKDNLLHLEGCQEMHSNSVWAYKEGGNSTE